MEYVLNNIQHQYEESDFLITCKIVVYNVLAMGVLAFIKEFFL